ncbi:MAG: hypothetical protein JSS82_07335 [Bacteroidetes bacterium]|nr:hypothetical protein [Bacteroidota bacterium]
MLQAQVGGTQGPPDILAPAKLTLRDSLLQAQVGCAQRPPDILAPAKSSYCEVAVLQAQVCCAQSRPTYLRRQSDLTSRGLAVLLAQVGCAQRQPEILAPAGAYLGLPGEFSMFTLRCSIK